jgi:hypothetical protein
VRGDTAASVCGASHDEVKGRRRCAEGAEGMTDQPESVNVGSVLKSAKFDVTIRLGANTWRLCKIVFSKSDGSVFVTFPDFKHTTGIVSVVTFRAGARETTMDLKPEGKVASHLVKYSHHPDGTVLFSQDGLVLSTVRRKAVPLDDLDGHFFTIHAQGLGGFLERPYTDDQSPHPKRTRLSFDLPEGQPESIKIVGRMYSVSALAGMMSDGMIKPHLWLEDEGGRRQPSFVCTPPDGWPGSDRCLLVSFQALPRLDRGRESSLLFIGGFDRRAVALDIRRSTTALAFSYPVEDPDALRSSIGTIDYHPRETAVDGVAPSTSSRGDLAGPTRGRHTSD